MNDHEDDDLDEDDLEGAYDGPIPEFESCMMCEDNDVPVTDRWNFELVDGEDDPDPIRAWICRSCHGKFDSPDDFDNFRSNNISSRLYRTAARLQRLLLLKAPQPIIAHAVIRSLVGSLFLGDELGGNDKMRDIAEAELLEFLKHIYRKD
jgi:hypothetical protein